jgi:transposase InsO family protein
LPEAGRIQPVDNSLFWRWSSVSVARTGQCWDNALAESFFATIKRELLDTTAWPSRAAARTALFDFIEGWYNLHRLHSSLGYLSPADYETALAA